MKRIILLALSLCTLAAPPAHADVKYAYNNPGRSVSFTFLSPTYFDFTDTGVLYLYGSPGYNPPPGIYSGPPGTSLLASVNGSLSTLVYIYDADGHLVFNYFLNSDFHTLGLHTASPLGGSGPATLKVSEVQSSVPETPLWAMMLAGFGAIGAAVRHRRREGAALTPA